MLRRLPPHIRRHVLTIAPRYEVKRGLMPTAYSLLLEMKCRCRRTLIGRDYISMLESPAMQLSCTGVNIKNTFSTSPHPDDSRHDLDHYTALEFESIRQSHQPKPHSWRATFAFSRAEHSRDNVCRHAISGFLDRACQRCRFSRAIALRSGISQRLGESST